MKNFVFFLGIAIIFFLSFSSCEKEIFVEVPVEVEVQVHDTIFISSVDTLEIKRKEIVIESFVIGQITETSCEIAITLTHNFEKAEMPIEIKTSCQGYEDKIFNFVIGRKEEIRFVLENYSPNEVIDIIVTSSEDLDFWFKASFITNNKEVISSIISEVKMFDIIEELRLGKRYIMFKLILSSENVSIPKIYWSLTTDGEDIEDIIELQKIRITDNFGSDLFEPYNIYINDENTEVTFTPINYNAKFEEKELSFIIKLKNKTLSSDLNLQSFLTLETNLNGVRKTIYNKDIVNCRQDFTIRK